MDTRVKNYDKIWKKVIYPLLYSYSKELSFITILEGAKETILKNYLEFNEHCRKVYMCSNVEHLDRHKVAACYMYAILKTEPLRINNDDCDEDTFYIINEEIALTVGFSVLRAFCQKDDDFPKEILDFIYPDAMNGIYRNNFAIELHFTKEENNYNILSLSHSLYLFELFNKQNARIKMLEDEASNNE